MSKAEDIIRETFSGVAKAIGVRIDISDEMITDLAATLQAEIDRIEAAESESFEFLNELALAFRSGEKHARPQYAPVLEGVRAVLAHLTSAGRLVPPGGMALTAEQVEDVRRVMRCGGGLAFEAAHARLRALFPATEPAEEETKAERRSFSTIQDVPKGTLFHTHGGEGSSLFVRNQSGDLRLCLNAGLEWSKLLQENDFPLSSGPYVEVSWSKFPQPSADPFAQPAVAEPAKEETKAEAVTRCPICFGLNGLRNRIHERYPEGGGGTNKPCLNSSPVVPAPTETEWQTLQDVPEGVTRVLDSECELWVQEGGQWFSTCQLHNPAEFAPFVAAEEG